VIFTKPFLAFRDRIPQLFGGAQREKMVAGGETAGLLHLRNDPEGMGPQHLPEPHQRLAMLVAEHIALTLSNLTIKDELRHQAIRDPLTDLFNRRYMEETLGRELCRASRHANTVGVIMIDLDGFK
jgi:GAF domain-containing protein